MARASVQVVLSSLIVSSTLAAQARHPVADPSITAESLSTFADDYFKRALAESHTSGAAFVVVQDGRPVLSRGFGLADRERKVAADPSKTLWRIASVSKTFTALATLQLAEHGRLALDDDVNQHLRGWRVPEAFGSPITIRQLLSHTSGLDDRFIGDGFTDGAQPTLTQTMQARLPARIRPPGSFLYSNYDYGLLGAVIEGVTGRSFADYMRDSILSPIGMTHSTFEQPLPAAWRDDVARPYGYSGANFRRWPVIYHRSSPGGGASATADDMGRYIAYLLSDPISATGLPSERFRQLAFGPSRLEPPARIANGYGWGTRLLNGERVVIGTGDLPGYSDLVALIPDRHLGFFVAQNSGNNAVSLGLLWAFLDRFFPPRAAATQQGDPSWTVPLSAFAGTYRPARYPHAEFSKVAILGSETHVTAGSDDTLRFWGDRWNRVGPLQFQRENNPLVLTFAQAADGSISALDIMERIPWHETRNAQVIWVLVCCVAFLSTLIGGVVSFVRRQKTARQTIWVLGGVASAIQLAFVVGFLASAAGMTSYALMLGTSPMLRAIFMLPLVALGLTLAFVGVAWRRRAHLSNAAIWRGVAFVAASGAFFAFLLHWNLLMVNPWLGD